MKRYVARTKIIVQIYLVHHQLAAQLAIHLNYIWPWIIRLLKLSFFSVIWQDKNVSWTANFLTLF